jgi:formamidopyrimidine-DNA glycosylase
MAIELPEARTLATQMNEVLPGKVIARLHVSDECASLIRQGFVNVRPADVTGKVIGAVTSQGKWIFLKLEPDAYLLFALETGGKILFHRSPQSVPERLNLRFDLSDGSALSVRIVGWGFAKAVLERELKAQRYPGHLGLSPLDAEEFTPARFSALLDETPKQVIKQVLTDQRRIAGIGNGYAQEILFQARIHPKRRVADLTEGDKKRLYDTIREVLSEALRLGGRDSECDVYDVAGRYRPALAARAEGKPCPRCGTPIEKLRVLGGASYVCPNCQE